MAGGYQVEGCFNASHGVFMDLVEASANLDGSCTTPVMLLHQMWNDFFASAGGDGHFLQVCHSQGVAHVRNALETYDEELRQKIRVVAVAPLAYVDPDTCEKVVHIVCENDFVPLIDKHNKEKYAETIKYVESHPDANQSFDHEFQSRTYEDHLEMQVEGFFDDFGYYSYY